MPSFGLAYWQTLSLSERFTIDYFLLPFIRKAIGTNITIVNQTKKVNTVVPIVVETNNVTATNISAVSSGSAFYGTPNSNSESQFITTSEV